MQSSLYLELLFPTPLPSYHNYTLLNLYHCISATYCNKKSHCYSEKKAGSYFNTWKAAATIYQNPPPIFFTLPFIHFKSDMEFVLVSMKWNHKAASKRTGKKLPWVYKVRNHWLPLCDLVGSWFSQTLQLINFRTGDPLKEPTVPFSLHRHLDLRSHLLVLLIDNFAHTAKNIGFCINLPTPLKISLDQVNLGSLPISLLHSYLA